MKFVDEFKDFISRGNVVDMAVGVVVGGAFKSIVDSLVADIINPGIAYVVSLITGALKTAATSTVGDTSAVESVMDMSKWIIPGTSINIGNFLSAIINFLILAFIIFCVVKGLNKLNDKFCFINQIQKYSQKSLVVNTRIFTTILLLTVSSICPYLPCFADYALVKHVF